MTQRSTTWVSLAMVIPPATAPASGQAPDTTRLFILSRQSNMSFDPEKDFAQHVWPAFSGE